MVREEEPPELPMRRIHWDDNYVAMIGDEPANGNAVARAEDGRLLAIVGYRDGYQHGQMRRYYPDGTPREEGFYERGRPVGTYREWHPNGQLQDEYLMTDDGTVVRHRAWREDGTLKYDTNPDHEANADSGPESPTDGWHPAGGRPDGTVHG